VEDFDDWTNWLLYKGGVGIKGDKSWESWWDEEQVCHLLLTFIHDIFCIAEFINSIAFVLKLSISLSRIQFIHLDHLLVLFHSDTMGDTKLDNSHYTKFVCSMSIYQPKRA